MNLPKESKILIYQANRNFNTEEIVEIEKALDNFMKDWNAHGAELTAAYALPYDRFIVVAVDESTVQTSGCSIDSLTQFIKGLEAKHNLGLLNQMMVSYSVENHIISLPLNEFKQKVRQGEIPQHASVFHNGVRTLEEFEESWELPLAESWVSALLK